MASPRRSHRGGYHKSKKVVEEDDGGQTRCVCNQQHHEGVMIQCETCKVWQHCPCVGLGDGEVTPDKYYCDSCRPENHPYRVQDGQLISTPAATGPKAKSSKKRSTMNSKDALFSADSATTHSHHSKNKSEEDTNVSASKRSNDTDDDSINTTNKSNGHTRSSKRRRKNVSNIDDSEDTNEDATHGLNGYHHDDQSSEATDKDSETPLNSTAASLKRVTKGKGSSKSKKAGSTKPSIAHSPPDSPQAKDEESSHPNDEQGAEPSRAPSPQQAHPAGRRTGGKKNSRPSEDEPIADNRSTVSASSKRRKLAKSETPSPEASSSAVDHDNEPHRAVGNESIADSHDASANSVPGSGNSVTNNGCINNDTALSSPTTATNKRTGSRKNAGHYHHHYKANSDSPTPSGTPQPMQPAPPAKVKYPSTRMSFKDMNKRAQNLLDYISRVQVEMVELKIKNSNHSSVSPTADAVATPRQAGLQVQLHEQATGSTETPDTHWLSTPPQSVHELSHGDFLEQKAQLKQVDLPCSSSSTGTGSEKSKAPMTPPHQLNGYGSGDSMESTVESHIGCNGAQLGLAIMPVTSLDLMDKLSGDLVRFQERFGHYVE
ncbi:hypothetical protein BGZ54_007037 [Gamsiella multidivaricata]|nr:hypothetical protein BGZ54_007037 [Gamsiella multidivaricata]